MQEGKRSIILFDGICNLCDGFVNFVYARDKTNKFYFAPLQSDLGQTLLFEYNLPSDLSTIVYISEEEHKFYTQSSAVLRIAYYLTFPWFLLFYLIVIPWFIRDFVYNAVAKNRYRIFGKNKGQCSYVPGLRKRFLDFTQQEDCSNDSSTNKLTKEV